MKLTELAKEPQLTKIVLDDQSLVERYKDPIEFWVNVYEVGKFTRTTTDGRSCKCYERINP